MLYVCMYDVRTYVYTCLFVDLFILSERVSRMLTLKANHLQHYSGQASQQLTVADLFDGFCCLHSRVVLIC